jgi:hypothetical protein
MGDFNMGLTYYTRKEFAKSMFKGNEKDLLIYKSWVDDNRNEIKKNLKELKEKISFIEYLLE